MDEMPTTRIVNGIHSHTAAIAAPVIIDAVGTRPMCRAGLGAVTAVSGTSTVVGGAGGAVTATMSTNLGRSRAWQHGVFPRPSRGKTPTPGDFGARRNAQRAQPRPNRYLRAMS